MTISAVIGLGDGGESMGETLTPVMTMPGVSVASFGICEIPSVVAVTGIVVLSGKAAGSLNDAGGCVGEGAGDPGVSGTN